MAKFIAARRNSLDWFLQIAYTTLRLFMKNGLQNHAAATAFYFLLSATPLMLLLSLGAQWLAGAAETSAQASIMLAALYDQLSLDRLTEMGFIPARGQLAVGGVGLVTLLLASRGLVHAIHKAFAVIFPDHTRHNFILNWTLPLLIVPIAFLLLGLAVAVQALLRFLTETDLLGDALFLFYRSLNVVVIFAVLWMLVDAAYWSLPKPRPRGRLAAGVAFLASLSLVLLFAFFEHFFDLEKYRAMYGALGGVVFVLIGAFIACLLFYFWAQCLYALGKVDIAALERLFLGQDDGSTGKLEKMVFARANRLLDKYGHALSPGEVLIREGDRSQTAYFLYAGRVGIYRAVNGVEKQLGKLDAGELFGEMAYLLDEPRTATIKAETDSIVLALPPALLEELMRYSAPLSRRIIDSLCQRLQRMNLASA